MQPPRRLAGFPEAARPSLHLKYRGPSAVDQPFSWSFTHLVQDTAAASSPDEHFFGQALDRAILPTLVARWTLLRWAKLVIAERTSLAAWQLTMRWR